MDEQLENTEDLDSGNDPAADSKPAPPGPAGVRPHHGTTVSVAAFMILLLVGLLVLYKLGQRPRIEAQAELLKTQRLHLEAPPVNVIRPVFAPATTELALPGQTAAWYSTTVFARVSGYLHAWMHDIGDRVKNNELLATIDTPDLDQQLKEAKAQVVKWAADVEVAKAQLAFAKVTAERFAAAVGNGAVSKQESDEKNAEYKTAQSKYDAAQAQLALGEATVGRLETFEGFKKVLAPYDGVLTRRDVDIGSLITAGSTANTTPMFVIDQVDTIRVYVKVPQSAVPDIYVGMTATATAPEYPGQAFTGKVARTAGAIDPVSRTLKVEVDVPNPKMLLTAGMYVQVGFQLSQAHPPLVIDAGAMELRPEGPTVAVVGPHDQIHFRKIRIARDLGNTIEVAEGLRPDEWIALNISDEITDGEKVHPIPLQASLEEKPAQAVAVTPTGPSPTSSHAPVQKRSPAPRLD